MPGNRENFPQSCGVKTEKIPQWPSKGSLQQAVRRRCRRESCESAAARRVAKQFRLAASTVRSIDLRYLERWAAERRKPGHKAAAGGG